MECDRYGDTKNDVDMIHIRMDLPFEPRKKSKHQPESKTTGTSHRGTPGLVGHMTGSRKQNPGFRIVIPDCIILSELPCSLMITAISQPERGDSNLFWEPSASTKSAIRCICGHLFLKVM